MRAAFGRPGFIVLTIMQFLYPMIGKCVINSGNEKAEHNFVLSESVNEHIKLSISKHQMTHRHLSTYFSLYCV